MMGMWHVVTAALALGGATVAAAPPRELNEFQLSEFTQAIHAAAGEVFAGNDAAWAAALAEATTAAEGVAVPMLGCASDQGAAAVRERLAKFHGQPVFVSTRQHKACFLFHAAADDATALLGSGVLQSAMVLPAEARISPSLFELVGAEAKTFRDELRPEHQALSPHPKLPERTAYGGSKAKAPTAQAQGFVMWAGKAVRASGHMVEHRRPQLRVHMAPARPEAATSDAVDERTPHAELWRRAFRSRTGPRTEHCQLDSLTSAVGAGRTITLSGLDSMSPAPVHQHVCWLDLVHHLATQPDVMFVEFRPEVKPHNFYAAAISQGSDPDTDRRAFWSMGINGTGEVIGIADTGLDDKSCFFRDDKLGNVTRTPNGTKAWITDADQRKVVQYVAHVDGKDELDGHGTHVVGSALGSCLDNWASTQPSPNSSGYYYGYTFDELVDYGYFSSVPAHTAPLDSAGMASGAKVAFFDIGDENGFLYTPSSLSEGLFPAAFEAGAHIHSDSWGTSYNGVLSDDIEIDQYSVDHPSFLVLIAAGNDGENGFYSAGSPAISKNSIAVGASESGPNRTEFDHEYVASFSSLGPTYDGRFKPDLVAPGHAVISARAYNYSAKTCDLTMMSGTSMATPVTAGNAALLREYVGRGFLATRIQKTMDNCIEANSYAQCAPTYVSVNISRPSGALIKAMLIHSAQNQSGWNYNETEEAALKLPYVGLRAPDYFQGFGRVDLTKLLNRKVFVVDQPMQNTSISSDEAITYTVEVAETSIPLVATLVWMDPPTTTSAAKQLVHDLDLTLTSPSGRVYTGNAGGMTWTTGGGVSSAMQTETDELNNVERIHIDAPEAGRYNLTVKANSLVYNTQSFALIATGDMYVAGPASVDEVFDDDNGGGDDDLVEEILIWGAVALGALALIACVLYFAFKTPGSDKSPDVELSAGASMA